MKYTLNKIFSKNFPAVLINKIKTIPLVYIMMILLLGMMGFNSLGAYLNSSVYAVKSTVYPNVVEIPADYTMRPKDKITLSFRFKMNEWLGPYDNIFQTADWNNGIRMELTQPQNWGLVFKDTQNDLVGISLGTLPQLTKWHSFSLSVYNRQVTAKADGKTLTNTFLPHMNFAINKIMVGSGFTNTRPFNGEVTDFSLRIFRNYKFHKIVYFTLLQLLLVCICWAIFNYTRKHLHKADILSFIILMAVSLLAAARITPLQEWGQLSNYALLKWQILTVGLWGGYILCVLRQIPGAASLLVLGTYLAWLFSFFTRISLAGVGALVCTVVFSGLLIRLLTFWLKALLQKILQILLSTLGFIAMFAVNASALYFYKVGDKGVNTDEMSAVFQTNMREGMEFIFSFFSSLELILLTIISILCAWMIWKSIQPATKKHIPFYCAALAALLVAGIWFSHYNNPAAQLARNLHQAVQNYHRIAQEYKYYQAQRKNNQPQATKQQKGELYVVVIGEASNPWHWSAYGYFRNTTPFAQGLTLRPDTIFFHRAYASFVHTVPSLTLALTQANQYNKENAFQAPSIIEVAKAAGFKTFWLSNQDKISLVDNPLTILAQAADKTVFTNQARFKGDESLLPLLDKTLKEINPQGNNLIVLHLVGSHAKYQVRYPKSFEKEFSSGEEFLGNHARNKQFVQEILNPYDNTIAYTDHILSQIYNKIQSVPAPVKTLLFFSDHGEDVYGEKFHNASLFTFDMARIPMFIWFSSEYQQRYPHIKKLLSSRTQHIFTLDTLYDTLLGIMGISTSLTQAKYDFSSPQYAINEKNALTMYTDATLQENLYARSSVRQIQEDPYLQGIKNLKQLQTKYPFHILANYTDPLIKTQQAIQRGFKGLELNVTAPGLMLGHGPEYVYNTSLQNFLSALPNQEEYFFWFDIKNLQEKDTTAVLEKLEKLDQQFHLKNRCLLETPLRSSSLAEWSQNGWKTALYLMYEDPNRQAILKSSQKSREYAQKAALDLKAQQAFAISFPADLYPFVKTYLEPLLPPDTRYLTWALPNINNICQSHLITDFSARPETKDKRLYALLLDF